MRLRVKFLLTLSKTSFFFFYRCNVPTALGLEAALPGRCWSSLDRHVQMCSVKSPMPHAREAPELRGRTILFTLVLPSYMMLVPRGC